MPTLAENHYGKFRVRLLKVFRDGDPASPQHEVRDAQHEVREWTVGVYLTGDFDACYIAGDNTGVMATDTMKNTVYSVARDSDARTPEDFALALARFLAGRNARTASIHITVEEKLWMHLKTPSRRTGQPHPTAFLQRGPELHTAEVLLSKGGEPCSSEPQITAGVRGLVLLKTAHSGFSGFERDELTLLPETTDRLLGTEATITWSYANHPTDYAALRERVLDALLSTFAARHSLSVQQTLYAMAEAALAAEPTLAEITLTMPNRHNLPVDLSRFASPFARDNPNMIFVPTDEPHGHIHARITRA